MNPAFSRARQVICQIALGQPGATNGEASLAQCMLGTEGGSNRRKAHGQSIVNPAAEHYKSAVEALLRDAGSIADGAQLTPVTEADLTVESHADIVALQEMLCQRLYVAHGPNGLMFYLLDRDQPGCTVATVAHYLAIHRSPRCGSQSAATLGLSMSAENWSGLGLELGLGLGLGLGLANHPNPTSNPNPNPR